MADEGVMDTTSVGEDDIKEDDVPNLEQNQEEDTDALLLDPKEDDQIDPEIALGEREGLLDSDEQYEVLDSVGDMAPEQRVSGDPNKDDNQEELSEGDLQQARPISPIVFSSRGEGKSGGESSSSQRQPPVEVMEHKISDKLFAHTRYFIMKSNNYDNVDIAKKKELWSTPPLNEKKLDKAFQSCKNVLLIFSVKESGRFQGIARLSSGARRDISPPRWVLPPGISSSNMSVFKLEWIHRGELNFLHTIHLKNPWNDSKPVKISRDGQEVEPAVGEELCRLWLLHAEGSQPSSQRTTVPRKPLRTAHHDATAQQQQQHLAGAGLHRPLLVPPPHPAAVLPAAASLQYQQYLQHHHHSLLKGQQQAFFKGAQSFGGLGGLPSLAQQFSSQQPLTTARLREDKPMLRRRSPSPKYSRSYRDRSPRQSSHNHHDSYHHDSHRHDNHRHDSHHHSHRDKERRSRRDKRSRSPDGNYGGYEGIGRDILLHGSYEDYLKEYSSRHSSSTLAPREFDAMVEDFLNKKH